MHRHVNIDGTIMKQQCSHTSLTAHKASFQTTRISTRASPAQTIWPVPMKVSLIAQRRCFTLAIRCARVLRVKYPTSATILGIKHTLHRYLSRVFAIRRPSNRKLKSMSVRLNARRTQESLSLPINVIWCALILVSLTCLTHSLATIPSQMACIGSCMRKFHVWMCARS